MTFLSIVVPKKVGQMLKITSVIYEPCSSACALTKLYANASKCIFGAEEVSFLGCFIGKRGLRADPTKVKAIVDWPIPKNQKDLRKWTGITN